MEFAAGLFRPTRAAPAGDDLVFTISTTGETLTIQEQLKIVPPSRSIRRSRNSVSPTARLDAGRKSTRVCQRSQDHRRRHDRRLPHRRYWTVAQETTAERRGRRRYIRVRTRLRPGFVNAYIVYITRDQPDTLEFTSDVAAWRSATRALRR